MVGTLLQKRRVRRGNDAVGRSFTQRLEGVVSEPIPQRDPAAESSLSPFRLNDFNKLARHSSATSRAKREVPQSNAAIERPPWSAVERGASEPSHERIRTSGIAVVGDNTDAASLASVSADGSWSSSSGCISVSPIRLNNFNKLAHHPPAARRVPSEAPRGNSAMEQPLWPTVDRGTSEPRQQQPVTARTAVVQDETDAVPLAPVNAGGSRSLSHGSGSARGNDPCVPCFIRCRSTREQECVIIRSTSTASKSAALLCCRHVEAAKIRKRKSSLPELCRERDDL